MQKQINRYDYKQKEPNHIIGSAQVYARTRCGKATEIGHFTNASCTWTQAVARSFMLQHIKPCRTRAVRNPVAKASKVEPGMAGSQGAVRRHNRRAGLRVGGMARTMQGERHLLSGVTARRDGTPSSFTALRERTCILGALP